MTKYAEKHNKFVESFRNFVSLVRDKNTYTTYIHNFNL